MAFCKRVGIENADMVTGRGALLSPTGGIPGGKLTIALKKPGSWGLHGTRVPCRAGMIVRPVRHSWNLDYCHFFCHSKANIDSFLPSAIVVYFKSPATFSLALAGI